MNRKRMFMVLGLTLALCGASVCAEESVTEAEEGAAAGAEAVTEAEASTEAGTSTETADDADAGSWMDYQITIDGEDYTFSMMYADFTAYGWTLDDPEDAEDTLDPYSYSIYYLTKDELQCSVYILNRGINTVSIEDCIVAGISIDNFYWEDVDSVVELPGGIVKGVSTLEDIEAAYGTPTDTYEGDLYTEYTYQEAYNQEVELTVYRESGVLEDIVIENFIEPEGYDVGEASEEVPQSVLAYVKPDALSDDPTAYEIQLEDEVYTIPVPVSVLIEDGWEIVEEDSDPVVAAHYYGWVYLRKDNQTFSTTVTNEEDYATTPENCWLEELEAGGYTLEMEGSLPGGICTGMTEEEFLAVLDDAGMDYEVSDSGDYRYYTYNSPSYGHSCEVEIYIGEDSCFEKDTIIGIACENSFD